MARPRTIHSIIVAADVTINPASMLTHIAVDVTATVAGLRVGYPVKVWAEALETGLVITNEHCSAANTLKFRLLNSTAGTIDAASQIFRVVQG